jgi:uncharacterized membrane protein YhaH (DUF805 family)
MNWYLAVLKKYAIFSGRAQRAEYWYFCLFNILIAIALGFIDGVLGTAGILGLIYSLGVLLLIGLVPIIGLIVILVFMVQDSKEGENPYGPNPKLAAA